MRLKTFSGKTTQEVMAQVRRELGADAIIITTETRKKDGLIYVTAALDAPSTHNDEEKLSAPKPTLVTGAADETAQFVSDEIKGIFSHHRPPTDIAVKLLKTANTIDSDDSVLALAAALDSTFHFLPFDEAPIRPIVLVGLPGAGKTVAAAKIAAQAILSGQSAAIISADTLKAGADAQTAAYAGILKLEAIIADEPKHLAASVEKCKAGGSQLIIVDTPGINPYDTEDIDLLQTILNAVDGEPVYIAAAGGDSEEQRETSVFFADLGCRRFIATKLDTVRRYGSLLGIAKGGPLAIAGIGASPYIGDRIESLNPVSLARLLAAEPKAMAERNNQRSAKKKPVHKNQVSA